ncbi:MAG: CPBP family intramembrane glutamic endopeptidase [Candidatus Nanopelagicales bacterium]
MTHEDQPAGQPRDDAGLPWTDGGAAAALPSYDGPADLPGAPPSRGPRFLAATSGRALAQPVPTEGWSATTPDRGTLQREMWLVLFVSIAASALKSLISLVDSLTKGQSLASQSSTLVGTFVADRPWLDVLYQLTYTLLPLVPVLLVVHLLRRSGEGRQAVGLDMRDWKRDLLKGAAIAIVIGGVGLVFYLFAYNMGWNVRIAAVTADKHWWTPLILLLSASYNAILEEVIVLAYFIHRMAQIGWKPWQQVGTSALMRAAYHLYQGFGGFLGNLAMGTVFAILFRRWGRVMPFLWAHLFIDAGAFLGYYYLHGHISWLP